MRTFIKNISFLSRQTVERGSSPDVRGCRREERPSVLKFPPNFFRNNPGDSYEIEVRYPPPLVARSQGDELPVNASDPSPFTFSASLLFLGFAGGVACCLIYHTFIQKGF